MKRGKKKMNKNTKGAFGSCRHNGIKIRCFHAGQAHKATIRNFPVTLRRKFAEKDENGKVVMVERVVGYLSRQACRKKEVQEKYLKSLFQKKAVTV
jgi:site-specific recombinase XerD